MIFIMPVMFIYTAILLDGTTLEIVVSVIGAVLGVIAWAMFLEAFGVRLMTSTERLLSGAAAVILLLPVDRMINYFLGVEQKLFYETYTVGAALLVVVAFMQLARRQAPASQVAPVE
jgi:hypothetical protein